MFATQDTTIDYDAIIQGLTARANDPKVVRSTHAYGADKPTALKEWRTIGVCAPRQSGSTHWMIRQVRENPEATLITVNLPLRKYILGELGEGFEDRVFTCYEIARLSRAWRKDIAGTPKMNLGKVTYIDTPDVCFGIVKRSHFYNWLAHHVDLDHLIIKMG